MRRDVLTFVGSMLAVAAVSAWALAIYEPPKPGAPRRPMPRAASPATVSPASNPAMPAKPKRSATVPPPQSTSQIRAQYEVCVGESEDQCPAHNAYVYCGTLDDWAKKECGKHAASKYSANKIGDYGGTRCGYSIFHVECTASE